MGAYVCAYLNRPAAGIFSSVLFFLALPAEAHHPGGGGNTGSGGPINTISADDQALIGQVAHQLCEALALGGPKKLAIGPYPPMQSRPFVGRAGQLLTKIIEAMGMKREDVWICNVLKCRPPNNRNPELDEVARKLNDRPRQTLGFRTPAEKLTELIDGPHACAPER